MASSGWLCCMVAVMVMCFRWSEGSFELTILHTNDVHARFDQTDARSAECSSKEAARGECYGGFPRLQHKVKELRANHSNVVLVDAGDQFQGTIWFYAFSNNITSHFMNLMGYDIMSLGNHEFDLGPFEVERFVSRVNFPVLSSNVNASAYPYLQQMLKGSHVLQVGGHKVGFVGYTTVETTTISSPGKVRFEDEVAAVRREVERLTEQGVDKVVCVGHAGFRKDLTIARDVVGVDVVVGGHTNTFLYTGKPPADEVPKSTYPEVVTRQDGSKALVVQDYAFGKYLGFLKVQFDDAGEVTSWSGNPILLDDSVPRDPDMVAELDRWRQGLVALANKTVGRTAVFLQGDRTACRLQECNLGNLIADGMVMQNLRHSDSTAWNHVAIALQNSGGIRASISKGDITVEDILTVQPFRSTIDIIEVNGSTIWAIMEHSATQWDPEDQHGGFLQHSGLNVVYDMLKPAGRRVLEVKVRCADCQVPQMEEVRGSQVYQVVLPSFLAEGGDGYSVIKDNTLRRHLNGDLDSDVLTEYITKFSPLVQGLEGRIRFANGSDDSDKCGTSGGDPAPPASLAVMSVVGLTTLLSHTVLSPLL
ncbi:snake venom 5'-nucleotidase-like [Babylonia areolata]|uniref:snake venom 5'-nucleotidase-like n=1 Tax=Babylonia areolata TaxID=304850 RepID=UPI003FD3AF25